MVSTSNHHQRTNLAIAITSVLGFGCSSFGSSTVAPEQAAAAVERFSSSDGVPNVTSKYSLGMRLFDELAAHQFPNIMRLQGIRLVTWAGSSAEDQSGFVDIQFDHQAKVGSFRGAYFVAPNNSGSTDPLEQYRVGPELVGTYVAKEIPAPSGRRYRVLEVEFKSMIADCKVIAMQSVRSEAERQDDLKAGRTPILLSISFTPGVAGTLMGIDPVESVAPIRCYVDTAGNLISASGDGPKSIAKENPDAFANAETFESLASDDGSLAHASLQISCRPSHLPAPAIRECWLPADQQTQEQTIVTFSGPNRRLRVIGLSSGGLDVVDGIALLHATNGDCAFRTVPSLASWFTHSCTSSLEKVRVWRHTQQGVHRRIEASSDSEFSRARTPQNFDAFLDGVQIAEEWAGLKPGTLAVRLAQGDKSNVAQQTLPLGTVAWHAPSSIDELEIISERANQEIAHISALLSLEVSAQAHSRSANSDQLDSPQQTLDRSGTRAAQLAEYKWWMNAGQAAAYREIARVINTELPTTPFIFNALWLQMPEIRQLLAVDLWQGQLNARDIDLTSLGTVSLLRIARGTLPYVVLDSLSEEARSQVQARLGPIVELIRAREPQK
ncbi:MAG: hypothetical protein K1X79_05700 [Oligoflexia bacterium]|nr:hypothetical protein [Oligoflexia bacterium]